MKLPENVEDCKNLSIAFATSSGNIRRNSLMDFVNVQSNGKIAMKLDEGDKLINVAMCDENNDIMLATRMGKCIRFPVTDVRVFVGRNSTGVRGIKLATGDEVISMASIAESARKAHLAHSLTTINANPQEKKLNKARLYVAKSRSGTTGEMIYLEHNLARCTFYETEPWTQDDIAGATQFTVKDTGGGAK